MKYVNVMLVLLFASCTSQPKEASHPIDTSPSTLPQVVSDELILRLSSEMIANPINDSQREHNLIINYAMDNGLPIYQIKEGIYSTSTSTTANESMTVVKMQYKVEDLEGQLFQNKFNSDQVELDVRDMVYGIYTGLRHANRREGTLLLRSDMAYGSEGLQAEGVTVIPPNTPLRFDFKQLEY